MNTGQLLDQAEETLVAANERFGLQGDEEDQAWEMLVHALGREPDYEEQIPAGMKRRFERLINRRITGEPIEFILGWVEFAGLRMDIGPGMFIPRLTSEFLARQAIRRIQSRRRPVHVDVATGIGPVAISSAHAVPHASVWGLDISRKALNQGRANAAKLGLGNVTFLRSDMFTSMPASLRGDVDVITIHPPYVASGEVAGLPEEIKKFEPRHTLTDGSVDGLGLARRVIIEGPVWLRPGGWLLIEIMPSESGRIRTLLRRAGYRDVRSTRGHHRETRVIVGRR